MRFAALATDYDGTLASQGSVSPQAVQALQAFRRAGRTLLLVTGRELDELLGIFPDIGVFDRVVAENGALLYCPGSGEHKLLGAPPPLTFVRELERRGVAPISVGRSIVATVTPHETTVLAVVRDLGLELQVIFNKGAVMVLPAGVNKATGLAAALDDLKLSLRNVAAIGDAENDHAMLRAAEFGVAVANALPAVAQEADYASRGAHADAVVELMDAIAADDLAQLMAKTTRRRIALGTLRDGTPVALPGVGEAVLVSGSTAEEAAAFAAGLLERMRDEGYQCCVVAAEGRAPEAHGVIALGASDRLPSAEEVVTALEDSPTTSAMATMATAFPPSSQGRQRLLDELPRALEQLRARLGRPHCVFVDACDADDAIPRAAGAFIERRHGTGFVMACTRMDALPAEVRRAFGAVVAIGEGAAERMSTFLSGLHAGKPPTFTGDRLADGEALMWSTALDEVVLAFRPIDTANASA